MRLTTALAASGLLAAALVVPGAPALTVSASHAPSHFLPGMVAAYATITVSNSGDGTATGPVTVTDVVPPSLTPTVAAGEGWTCTAAATTTCTRHDALAPRSSYPPIRIVVDVSGDVPAEITNTASVAFGRDAGARAGSATDTIAARP